MKLRKELWFGFSLMAIIGSAAIYMLLSAPVITNGHLGLLMLSLVVVAIMLGFPTAFTLMGMGMMFAFFAYHSGGQSAGGAITQTLDLMVQRAFSVMGSDVLIAIPLFVFMGYLVERANLIEKLFGSLHLSLARVPGSLAVATLVTCAVFATATGIVGAVVTLMGLLALPQMLRAGYDVRISAGAITAGGCLGILIPPSVLLIVYGATAGVSVVQLYAGAFFPGLMLAGLYIVYAILVGKFKPHLAPPLTAEQRHVPLPERLVAAGATGARRAVPGLLAALKGRRNAAVPTGYLLQQLFVALLPLLLFAAVALVSYRTVTGAGRGRVDRRPAADRLRAAGHAQLRRRPAEPPSGWRTGRAARCGRPGGAAAGGRSRRAAGRRRAGRASAGGAAWRTARRGRTGGRASAAAGGVAEPPAGGGLAEPPAAGAPVAPPAAGGGLAEPSSAGGLAEPPGGAGASGGQRAASTAGAAGLLDRRSASARWRCSPTTRC